MSNYLKVKDCSNYVRDKNSNAIIHTDDKEYLSYKKQRESLEQSLRRINNLEKELEKIKEILKI